jgi:hypothetical protein
MNIERKTVTVAGPAGYPDQDSPQVDVSRRFAGRVAAVLMTAGEAFISLDGVNDHAQLLSGTPATTAMFESNAYKKVWVRSPSAGSVTVQIIIEQVR